MRRQQHWYSTLQMEKATAQRLFVHEHMTINGEARSDLGSLNPELVFLVTVIPWLFMTQSFAWTWHWRNTLQMILNVPHPSNGHTGRGTQHQRKWLQIDPTVEDTHKILQLFCCPKESQDSWKYVRMRDLDCSPTLGYSLGINTPELI